MSALCETCPVRPPYPGLSATRKYCGTGGCPVLTRPKAPRLLGHWPSMSRANCTCPDPISIPHPRSAAVENRRAFEGETPETIRDGGATAASGRRVRGWMGGALLIVRVGLGHSRRFGTPRHYFRATPSMDIRHTARLVPVVQGRLLVRL